MKAYYTIKEASEIAHVKPHVIRYWESEFKALKPKKTHGGRRRYSVENLKLLLLIKKLLYEEGYRIKGARKRLTELRKSSSAQIELPFQDAGTDRLLLEVKKELKAILSLLRE